MHNPVRPGIIRPPSEERSNQLIAPLAPKEGMKIATRIENEATLKVSSLARLKYTNCFGHYLLKEA